MKEPLTEKPFSKIKATGKEHNFGKKKDELRTKILKKIKDNDTILLLESPACYAIKEIIELGLKPKKILIPNNQEFEQLVLGLQQIDLPFEVEVINTTALQLIADLEETLGFVSDIF